MASNLRVGDLPKDPAMRERAIEDGRVIQPLPGFLSHRPAVAHQADEVNAQALAIRGQIGPALVDAPPEPLAEAKGVLTSIPEDGGHGHARAFAKDDGYGRFAGQYHVQSCWKRLGHGVSMTPLVSRSTQQRPNFTTHPDGSPHPAIAPKTPPQTPETPARGALHPPTLR